MKSIMTEIRSGMAVLAGIVWLSLVAGQAAAQGTTSASGVTEGIVTLADSKIQYFSRGKGETIVLLPGGTLTVGYLDGLAEALAEAGYRVVGINFRGSGKSTGSSKGVTLQTNADDVAGVVKALQLGPVHMAGNDFGNRVARMFAAAYPKLTRSVILLAAGGKIPPKPAAERALMTIFNPQSTDANVLAVMPYLVSNPADSAQVWAMFKPSRDPGAASIERAAAEATPLEVWWAPPGKTKYLILQGAEDQIALPENGVELKKELGMRATLVNVPGAAKLDEGLEVLTGLWSGQPFSYDGTQYRVKDAHFAPPAQHPRIPIWVAGAWPHKPPFRWAARWDGVFPISQVPLTKHLTPAEIRDIQAYIKKYRTSATPFEVVSGGQTSGSNGAEDTALVTPHVEAGLTWWRESPGQRTPAEMRERIRQGPPSVGACGRRGSGRAMIT